MRGLLGLNLVFLFINLLVNVALGGDIGSIVAIQLMLTILLLGAYLLS